MTNNLVRGEIDAAHRYLLAVELLLADGDLGLDNYFPVSRMVTVRSVAVCVYSGPALPGGQLAFVTIFSLPPSRVVYCPYG